jgi:hypothetical protein
MRGMGKKKAVAAPAPRPAPKPINQRGAEYQAEKLTGTLTTVRGLVTVTTVGWPNGNNTRMAQQINNVKDFSQH